MIFQNLPGFFINLLRVAGADLAPWVTGTRSQIPASALPPGVGSATPTDPNPPWAAGLTDTIGQRAVYSGEIYTQVLADPNIQANWQLTTADNAVEVTVTATPTNYTAATPDVEAHLAGIDAKQGTQDSEIASKADVDGQTFTGQATFTNGLAVFGELGVFGEVGTDILNIRETLFGQAAIDSIPVQNQIDVGVDLSLLDAGMGVLVATDTQQFPTIVFAFADAGLKVAIIASTANGVASNSVATLTPVFGGNIETTDTTDGGTLEVRILKQVFQINDSGLVSYIGGGVRQRTVAANIDRRPDDYIIGVDSSAPRTIALSPGGRAANVSIKDETGNAGTNNITVTNPSIDGAVNYTISTNYGYVQLYSSDFNVWHVIAEG
jgi:hypothetical protein